MAGRIGMIKGATLVLALTFGVVGPNGARAENMADALVGAYNSSGLLEQNRALLRAADENVAIAVSALRPILDWTTRVTRNLNESRVNILETSVQRSTFFTGLQLDLLIYDGGASKLGVQASKETVLATRQTLLEIEQNILLRAVAAYMNVLLAAENVSLQKNSVRLGGEELRAAQDRFEVGEVTRTDVALAESRLAAGQHPTPKPALATLEPTALQLFRSIPAYASPTQPFIVIIQNPTSPHEAHPVPHPHRAAEQLRCTPATGATGELLPPDRNQQQRGSQTASDLRPADG